MAAKTSPDPTTAEHARRLRALADRVERTGQALPRDLLAALEQAECDEHANPLIRYSVQMSDKERALLDELGERDKIHGEWRTPGT